MLKFIHLLNKFAMSYTLHISNIKKLFLSINFIFNIVSKIKYIKNSKIYSYLKFFISIFIYFNLFMLSTDFILKYESDEIYIILNNIYNNLKNISYNSIKDIIKYLKEKLYIIDKLEDLIKDNSIEDNSIDKPSNNDSNNDSNNYTFYIICGIVIVSSIVIYIYYNNDNNNMNDLLKDLSHLKHINHINDNDSLIDMNLDESGYFTNTTPTDDFLKPISRTSSLDSNKTITK